MQIELLQPVALVALLLLPIIYLIHRRRPGLLTPRVARLSVSLRLLIVALLVLSLAAPQIRRPLDDLSVVFLVERSERIPGDTLAAIREWIRTAGMTMGPNDQAAIVTFSATAQVEEPLAKRPVTGPAASEEPAAGSPNLAEAMRLAGTLFRGPEMKRLVIIAQSDETSEQAVAEARSLAARGVQVSVYPIRPQLADPEVLIDQLEAPPKVREGEPYDVQVVVYSTYDTDAILRLWADGTLISEDTVRLETGPNRFYYQQTNRPKGFHAYRAQVEPPADSIPYNNEAQSYTVVGDRGRVLIVEGTPGQSAQFAQVMQQNSIDVDIIWDQTVPPSLADLKPYDAIVLHNVSASRMSRDQMLAIQQYVQSLGKGVLALGGKDTFGLGGFAGTPLENVLPVSMTPPSRRENPSVALLLVIDKSGSMEVRSRSDTRGGATKMAMAKEAAALATDILDSNDQVGVIAFDMTPRWVVPFTELGDADALDRVKDQINALRADGGTEIYPALQLAYDQIRIRNAQIRHIVLLSDGRSFSSGNYDQLTQQMRQNNITLSSVAIGGDSDTQLLRRLAEQGGGQYYFTDEARAIPKLVTEETRRVSATREIEADFQPRVTWASPALNNLVGAQLPMLHGYVVTTPKPNAQVILSSHTDDPILAQWQTGLGRAMVWTPDVHDRWGADWMSWPDSSRFWAQAVRWTMPSPLDGEIQLLADVAPNRANLKIDIVNSDGNFENLVETRAVATSYVEGVPGVERVELAVRQVAPGQYETSFSPRDIGTYRVEVMQLQDGAVIRSDEFGFVVPYPREYGLPNTTSKALERLARDGGGKPIRSPSEVFAHDVTPQPYHSAILWPWLIGLALVLIPFDVAVRRLWPQASGWRWHRRILNAVRRQ